jgi:hypothetical protein
LDELSCSLIVGFIGRCLFDWVDYFGELGSEDSELVIGFERESSDTGENDGVGSTG